MADAVKQSPDPSERTRRRLRSSRGIYRVRQPVMTRSGVFRNGSTPTVLLVHGPFADGSMWAGVIAELQAAGIGTTALANPLRGLVSDAAYVASAAAAIDGPVMLAGHSYGGAVITAAGSAPGNVVGLVYVTGYALEEGESAVDISGRFPGSQLAAALRPATFPDANGDPGVELYIDREAFPQLFAADLPHRAAAVAGAAQRPITAAALEEKSPAAAWKTTPSWYVIATARPGDPARGPAVHGPARRSAHGRDPRLPCRCPDSARRGRRAHRCRHQVRPRPRRGLMSKPVLNA